MKPVRRSSLVTGIGHDIQRIALDVDHWSGSDADIFFTAATTGRLQSRDPQIIRQQNAPIIRVDYIYRVIGCSYINDIVNTLKVTRGNMYSRHDQPLCIHPVV